MLYISIIIIAILTLAVFGYVFFLTRKTETNIFLRIFISLLDAALTAGFYGNGVYMVIMYYSGAIKLPDNYLPLLGGPSIGFAWFCVIIGLFLLRQFFGAILSREDVCWLSE